MAATNSGDGSSNKLRISKEDAALYTRKLFLYINYALFTAASASIVTVLLLKLAPTGWGWLLLILDILTVLSGIAGCVTSSEPGCYTFHVIATAVTAVLQGVVSLVLFTRTAGSLRNLRSTSDEGVALVKMKAGLSLIMFCVQWVALALACIIHYCMFGEFYLEGRKRRGGARVAEEPGHVVVVVDKEGEKGAKGVGESQEFVNVEL